MTRRLLLSSMGSILCRAAARLPANRNVKWALSLNLWNHFAPVAFTDILDVMRDTGFTGIRLTQYPSFLAKYRLTIQQLEQDFSRRNLHAATISFGGPVHEEARHKEVIQQARDAMKFLGSLGANRLVVFSPGRLRPGADSETAWRSMCLGFNRIGEAAGEMGFRAGLHNHLDEIVENQTEVDRAMAGTDPKLFGFAPDTAHLHLAGCDVVRTLDRYKQRIVFLDYKDAKWTTPSADLRLGNGTVYAKDSKDARFFSSIYDLGDGEVDFPACHRILRTVNYQGWNCVDLDTARDGPRASYARCGEYIVEKLEPIYV
jgi:sugar phosphate isomerase/epimerase